jgi:Domain of unknown function (DUF6457)
MTVTAEDWAARFAARLGTGSPTEEELVALLDLAGVAAHASVRTAAPLSCWLAARAGASPAQALDLARQLAAEIEQEPTS